MIALAAALAGDEAPAPAVRWEPSQDVAVDLDGDGARDRLRFGLTDTELVVSLQLRGSDAGELRFPRDGIGCNPVDFAPACGEERPSVRTFVIDDEGVRAYADAFELSPAVFVATGRAEIASFPIGETDPIWFFWNAEQRQFDWLRM